MDVKASIRQVIQKANRLPMTPGEECYHCDHFKATIELVRASPLIFFPNLRRKNYGKFETETFETMIFNMGIKL
jgi:hypothetical protein